MNLKFSILFFMMALISFEGFSSERNFDDYLLRSKITSIRKGGRFNSMNIATCEDGSEWVVLLNGNLKERFMGYLYLEAAISELATDRLKAAENKIGSYMDKIHYFSRYVGENKLTFLDFHDEKNLLSETGFKDFIGNANLRKKDDILYVFDTEKGSFSDEVHSKISEFEVMHDTIYDELLRDK